jgi:hypothetical protein
MPLAYPQMVLGSPTWRFKSKPKTLGVGFGVHPSRSGVFSDAEVGLGVAPPIASADAMTKKGLLIWEIFIVPALRQEIWKRKEKDCERAARQLFSNASPFINPPCLSLGRFSFLQAHRRDLLMAAQLKPQNEKS